MSRIFFRILCVSLFVVSAQWLACEPTKPPTEIPVANENGTPKDSGEEQVKGDRQAPTDTPTPKDGEPQTGKWLPAGHVAMSFTVDDTANKTYKEKQLYWNGSFVYESKTNTVVYSSAWQPTDGPFPPLYDDGPIDRGGHEPPGAKAGDHIFGIVVFVKPDPKSNLEFEYGLINDEDHWLWEGANGLIVVKKDVKDGAHFKGDQFALPKHGNIDIKVTINIKKLPKEFAIDDITNAPPIFLKGTMSDWSHVQVSDKGKRGDTKAGDGVLSYVQSQVLDYSPHFGLLTHKRHVQFVFQFNSITGREYKDIDDKALADGVEVWADCNGDGTFSADEKQKIVWEKDSRGAIQNTTVIVCEGKQVPCTKNDCSETRCKDTVICKEGCKKDSECKTNETCDQGKCKPKQQACAKSDCPTARCKDDPICKCSSGGDCKADEKCNTQTSKCEPKQKCTKDSECPANHTCNTSTGACLTKTCTLADCQTTRCQADPVCTNPNKGPLLYFIVPSTGSLSGGTKVTITGERFDKAVKIQFGGKDCTNMQWVSAQKLTCSTPSSGSKGSVDVVAINPDGQRNTFPQGFRYGAAAGATVGWCRIQWPNSIPDTTNGVNGVKAGQASPVIYGWVYKKGSTDRAGKGPGITANVGIGPVGTNPSGNKQWSWFPATYLGDKAGGGNPISNDEYKGTVTPPSAGNYDYAYRFSADGVNFHYCDRGGNTSTEAYRPSQAGKLTAH